MVLAELVTYLAASGCGTAGTNLFYGSLKDTFPDVITLLQEYGGMADEPNLGDPNDVEAPGQGTRFENPRIQVLCRGARDDYDTPRARAEAARKALNRVSNQSLSGVYYMNIDILQPPFRLGTDDNFRIQIAFNIQVTKRLS